MVNASDGFFCAQCLKSISPGATVAACRACADHFCNDCRRGSPPGYARVVVPDASDVQGLSPEKLACAREGVWEKLLKCCKRVERVTGVAAVQDRMPSNAGSAQDQMGWASSNGLPYVGLRPGEWEAASGTVDVFKEEDAYTELDEALKTAEPYPHMGLLSRSMNLMKQDDIPFRCFNGCSEMVTRATREEHDAECPRLRVRCNAGTSCTAWVERRNLDLHVGVCKEISAAVKTWNIPRIQVAMENGERLCAASRMEHNRLHRAFGIVSKLQPKITQVQPALARGHISIDYDNCAIGVETNIPFAARKQPDTSAEFAEGQEDLAFEVIADLSVVIKAFGVPLIVEGHTGQTEPAEYWGELAENRARVITDLLEQKLNVEKGLVTPMGCPGGGAKVVVRPADDGTVKRGSMDAADDL
jgi:hypothetical protein